jgi:hypothetical protein
VTYYIDAESEEQVKELMNDYEFMDKAEYWDTKESQWGFDVDDVYYDEAEIREVKE